MHIDFKEITHISKDGCESIIYTVTGKFRVYSSLQDLLNDLPVNDFFRVSKSHIVSLQFMNGVKGNKIIVADVNAQARALIYREDDGE